MVGNFKFFILLIWCPFFFIQSAFSNQADLGSAQVVEKELRVEKKLEPTVIHREWAAPARGIAKGRYLGCFIDRDSNQSDVTKQNRDIVGYAVIDIKKMTVQSCISQCKAKGFSYAGLQYGHQCFCGNSYGKFGSAERCNMPCVGNPMEICGGHLTNSVYAVE